MKLAAKNKWSVSKERTCYTITAFHDVEILDTYDDFE